jgi:hypothetical protein
MSSGSLVGEQALVDALNEQLKDGRCECGSAEFRFYYEECIGQLRDGKFTAIDDNGEGVHFAECQGCNEEYSLD